MRLSVIVFAVLLGGCASHSDDPCEKVWSEVGEADGKLGFTAPLSAITAAVVGVILNLALFFAYHLLWPKGFAGAFVAAVSGSYSSVVGLPLHETANLLESARYPVRAGWADGALA